MSKHIDLLAVGMLLAGIAFLTAIRRSPEIQLRSAELVEFTTDHVGPVFPLPDLPRLCLTRD